MDRVLINPSIVSGIADAVREKTKTSEPIMVSALPEAIRGIRGGSGENVKEVVEAVSGVVSDDDVVLANGIAEGATDAPSEQTWNGERQTAGGVGVKDSVAFVDKVKGNTVKMVQKCNRAVMSYMSCSLVSSGDVIKVRAIRRYSGLQFLCPDFKAGHKYLPIFNNSSNFTVYTSSSFWFTPMKASVYNKTDGEFALTYQCNTDFESYPVEIDFVEPQFFDLTAMGWDDITTADQFAQRLGYSSIDAVPYIPYTEGEVVPMKAEAIVSEGGNLMSEIDFTNADNWTKVGTDRYTLPLPVNTGLPYTLRLKTGTATDFYYYLDEIINGDSTTIARFVQGKLLTETATFTPKQGASYVIWTYSGKGLAQIMTNITEIVLNVGDSIKSNKPHFVASLSLPVSSILHEGQPLFPDGLNGIGDVKDEVDFARGKAVKRFVEIDLGDLDWNGPLSGERGFGCPQVASLIRGKSNAVCAKYPLYKGFIYDSILTNATSSIIGLNNGGNIYIKDMSMLTYTNTQFKTALRGVKLIVELVTPVEVSFDPQKAYYKVESGGSESLQADGLTAPLTASLGYRGATESTALNLL